MIIVRNGNGNARNKWRGKVVKRSERVCEVGFEDARF
jgi:hypothetical protein